MPIGLTHFGEAVVQALIEQQPDRFFDLCGRSGCCIHGGRVFREVKLSSYGGRHFDGGSRVDLIVPLNATEALPIEVKLGETRLSKNRVDSEWLSGCRISHGGTRWSGNMMSILDQLIPPSRSGDQLVASVQGREYSLTHNWCLVVRGRTAKAWTGPDRPAFSRATIVSFDAIVSSFQPAEFDAIVRQLLDFPYYDSWIGGG